jgi:uncharacterized protein
LQIEFENLFNEQFISSYGKNFIVINKKKYFKKIILINSAIDDCKDIKDLLCEEFFVKKIKQLNSAEYNFILFGTGKKIRKIPSKTYEFIVKNNIPFELMNSISAFKTYNILLAQGKKILAFLDLET